MKIEVVFILTLCCWINVYSQHPTISKLKSFAAEADMSYYLNKAQQNLLDDYQAQCKEWGMDKLLALSKQTEIDLYEERLVPILSIRFINTENYNFNDNIYDYMVVDTIRNFMFACIDEKKRVKYFVNYFDGDCAYYEVQSRKYRKLKQIIKHIDSRVPDLLIYCSSLSGFPDYNGFMFIKDDNIYIWNIKKNDAYELNDYLRDFYKLERIRKLKDLDKPVWVGKKKDFAFQ